MFKELLKLGKLKTPHEFLGLQKRSLLDGTDQKIIRLFRPGADSVTIEINGAFKEVKSSDSSGIFEIDVPEKTTKFDYRVYHQNGLLSFDPFSFNSSFSVEDETLFSQGNHDKIYEKMGGRLRTIEGVQGVSFSIWAPNASQVSLVADFNYWNGQINPMRFLSKSGVWEIFVPGLGIGEKYKFEIRMGDGSYYQIKTDPYGLHYEMRPKNASIVSDMDSYSWTDQSWMSQSSDQKNKPMNIYEVHLGSWRRAGEDFLGYREIAPLLAEYVKKMGFTHVELLPLSEHPLDESWGYQVTGFFGVSSRYGTPSDFQEFVNYLHNEGIGVILDWVPAHFPTDEFSFSKLDGTALYEHEDPRQGFHPHWNTLIFNYGRYEVKNFLMASALYYLDKMHIDGIRVDAVASMLYLDYGRAPNEWIPNIHGTNENLEAIDFLKSLNQIIHNYFPNCMVIAEESSTFGKVSFPIDEGGLGFDYKWNMGWMNDTLTYIQTDFAKREEVFNKLTLPMSYHDAEHFILVLSHDEVVHEKNSLFSKMPGEKKEKYAGLRLLLSYMVTHPGKNLLFMGGELGQINEWHCKEEIHWSLLKDANHVGIQNMVRDMNHLCLDHSALYEKDFCEEGFAWIEKENNKNQVLVFVRKSSSEELLCVHNFSNVWLENYQIEYSFPKETSLVEIFNSDNTEYQGEGRVNQPITYDGKTPFSLSIPPLSTIILCPTKKKPTKKKKIT